MVFLSSLSHTLLGILVFLLIFSVLIILHELGHFFMARLAKVKVEEFGFGLPPKIWVRKTKYTANFIENGKSKTVTDEMSWTINAIPFGGFVRMFGEDTVEGAEDNPRAFCNRPLGWRMAIVLAGVAMNFLLAFVLFTVTSWAGFNPIIDPNLSFSPRFESYFSDGHVQEWVEKGFYEKKENGAFILAADPNSPAGKAGLLSGDQIITINEVPMHSREEVQKFQKESTASEFHYTIQRDSEITPIELSIAPDVVEGEKVLGVLLLNEFYFQRQKIKLSLFEAIPEAYATSKRLIRLSFGTIRGVFSSTFGNISRLQTPQIPEGVGGPVAIWDSTRQLVEIGDVSKILQFAGILSLSLAVMNLIPFPALDGGRFFFQILELLLGIVLWPVKKLFPKKNISHRLPQNLEGIIHVIGYSLLLLFIVAVTWRDISRIFFS